MADDVWRKVSVGKGAPPGIRDPARASGNRDGYMWSTPKAAAFFIAIIVLALILAQLLALVIDLQPG